MTNRYQPIKTGKNWGIYDTIDNVLVVSGLTRLDAIKYSIEMSKPGAMEGKTMTRDEAIAKVSDQLHKAWALTPDHKVFVYCWDSDDAITNVSEISVVIGNCGIAFMRGDSSIEVLALLAVVGDSIWDLMHDEQDYDVRLPDIARQVWSLG